MLHILLLQFLCTNYPIVDDHAKDAMGDVLYEMFIVSVNLDMAWPSYLFMD
jgi:hypothetical protein